MDGIFFYKDPMTGKRKPLPTFWALMVALGAILFMLMAVAYAYRTRSQWAVATLPPTLTPLATSTFTPEPTDTPTPTATWTPVPTQDPWAVKIREKLEAIAGCPRDVNEWQWAYLTDASAPASRIIGLPCARDNLIRTIAWVHALRIGYERDEITTYLGFEDYPVLFAAKGLRTPFRTDVVVWLTDTQVYPDIVDLSQARFWNVYEDGTPANLVYLMSCYPTYFVKKGRKVTFAEYYNAPYPAQCLVWTWYEGKVVYHVTQFPDGKVLTMRFERKGDGVTFYELFAYLPDKNFWSYQGYVDDSDWIKPIEGQLAQLQEGLYQGQRRKGAYLDGSLLSEEWGIKPQPLPEGWQEALVDPEEYLAYIKQWQDDMQRFEVKYSWPYKNPEPER